VTSSKAGSTRKFILKSAVSVKHRNPTRRFTPEGYAGTAARRP
jgi:hypothetical protein